MSTPAAHVVLPPPAGREILSPEAKILIVARVLRLFAYGFLSVVLVFYLTGVGLDESHIGLLLSLTLVGDTAISLFLTTRADRAGRRLTLIVGALLMTFAGIVFAFTGSFLLLLIAGIIGVISPSGKEVGPFLSVEQAALAHVIPGERRMHVFAWFNLIASFAGAIGVLFAKWIAQAVHHANGSAMSGYRYVVLSYAGVGILLAVLFAFLGSKVEWNTNDSPSSGVSKWFGLGESRGVVLRLAGLFSIDAFAGGFVIDSLTIYWFHTRFDVGLATLGWIYFATNAVAGISGLLAAKLAKRFGLINTMVFTHLPSNVLLILVPLIAIAAVGGVGAAVAVQHFTDGCADPPGVHDGDRPTGGALGGGRHHRHGSHDRRGDGADARRAAVFKAERRRCPVFHRRWIEDCVRPVAVSRVRVASR